MVCHYDCDPERPTCLYDFTMKVIMFDYQAFSIPDLKEGIDIIENYFYPSEEENAERKKQMR